MILCAIRGENEARVVYNAPDRLRTLGVALARHLDHIRESFNPADYPATKTRLEWWGQELQARWIREAEARTQQEAIEDRKAKIIYVCIGVALVLQILYNLFWACR